MSKQKVIVVFGSGGVGKSAMTIQFINGLFVSDYDPTIEDSYTKTMTYQGQTYSVEILDTAGEEGFLSMRLPYIRKGDAFLLIYSIDNRITFEEIEQFYSDIVRNKATTDVPIVLCGNKSDREEFRQISQGEGEVLAHQFNCKFFETSAKTNTNISEAFEAALCEIISKQPKPPEEKPQEQVLKWYQKCLLL